MNENSISQNVPTDQTQPQPQPMHNEQHFQMMNNQQMQGGGPMRVPQHLAPRPTPYGTPQSTPLRVNQVGQPMGQQNFQPIQPGFTPNRGMPMQMGGPPPQGHPPPMGQPMHPHQPPPQQQQQFAPQPSGTVLDKAHLDELVSQIHPNTVLEEAVKDALVEYAEEFVESIIEKTCKLIKNRGASKIEGRDVEFIISNVFHMPSVPRAAVHIFQGPSAVEIGKEKNVNTEAHKQRLAMLKKQIKKI